MTEFKKGLSTGDPERPVATAPPAAVVSTVAADPAADHATTDGAQKP
jgi:hypothetical protein